MSSHAYNARTGRRRHPVNEGNSNAYNTPAESRVGSPDSEIDRLHVLALDTHSALDIMDSTVSVLSSMPAANASRELYELTKPQLQDYECQCQNFLTSLGRHRANQHVDTAYKRTCKTLQNLQRQLLTMAANQPARESPTPAALPTQERF